MGTIVHLTTTIWRRVAALEQEFAASRQVVPQAPRNASNVIELKAAVWRRVEALEQQVAEWQRVVSQTPRNSWWHKAYTTELIEAERRLSIAQGMRREAQG